MPTPIANVAAAEYQRKNRGLLGVIAISTASGRIVVRYPAKGFGWSYGDKAVFVLSTRELPRTRETVEFYSGDLTRFVNERLRLKFRSIWLVGGGVLSGECLRLGLADEVRYSIVPIVIGDGISFFEKLDRDVALHLADVKAYRNVMVELRYEVRA